MSLTPKEGDREEVWIHECFAFAEGLMFPREPAVSEVATTPKPKPVSQADFVEQVTGSRPAARDETDGATLARYIMEG